MQNGVCVCMPYGMTRLWIVRLVGLRTRSVLINTMTCITRKKWCIKRDHGVPLQELTRRRNNNNNNTRKIKEEGKKIRAHAHKEQMRKEKRRQCMCVCVCVFLLSVIFHRAFVRKWGMCTKLFLGKWKVKLGLFDWTPCIPFTIYFSCFFFSLVRDCVRAKESAGTLRCSFSLLISAHILSFR